MEFVSVSALLQAVPIVAIALALVLSVLRHRVVKRKQREGLQWLQAYRFVIAHVQTHRGLSSALLSGDAQLGGGVDRVREQVSRDFDVIAGIGSWVKTQPEWESITQHWARLVGNIDSIGVSSVIDQHNHLIQNIVFLVDVTANVHHLNRSNSNQVTIWRELLTLAELMGQIRANGVAYLGCKDSAYQSKARKKLQDLTHSILLSLESPRCQTGLDGQCVQNIVGFLQYTDDYLLCGESAESTYAFFDRASIVIDELYDHFDSSLQSFRH